MKIKIGDVVAAPWCGGYQRAIVERFVDGEAEVNFGGRREQLLATYPLDKLRPVDVVYFQPERRAPEEPRRAATSDAPSSVHHYEFEGGSRDVGLEEDQ